MGNCLQFLRRRVAGDDFTRLDNLSTNTGSGSGRRTHSSRGSSGGISSASASSGSERSRLHRNMQTSSYVNQLYMNSAFGTGGDEANAAEMKALDEKRKARVRCLLEQIPVDMFIEDGKGDTECAICMGDFQPGDPIRFLPCLHSYHLQCIDNWLIRSFTCPSCMEPVDSALLSAFTHTSGSGIFDLSSLSTTPSTTTTLTNKSDKVSKKFK
uniref:RING-type domain-containing protein n=1 Tax=Meloidogyne enterolobii TaxID=390850 RepID=A0A6V7VLR4_MELEN|nr:unnamed protein product [Meloidogyne enterolobii]